MLVALLAALAAVGCRPKAARPPGYRVPLPNFSIEPAASPAALGPVSAFTFDSRGRPVVVKEGSGLVTRLDDLNGDGVFETERAIAAEVRSVRGLWFDGRTLYLLGSSAAGQYGLYRLEDRDNNGDMERVELLAALDAPAPGSHTIGRSPQGAPVFLHGGKWLRWSEERRALSVMAGGFGNARVLVFDADGEAFVLDADAPRLIHAIPGGEYGATGERLDTLPPLRESAGTALSFYRHDVYPEAFRGALFEAQGPLGRIVAQRMRPVGATYEPDRAAPLAEFVAGEPLTITGLATGPDGFVYFSSGGNSGGGLYRIRYTPSWQERWRRWREQEAGGLRAILHQPEPLSSWGHAALARQHDYLEARWGDELEQLAKRASAETGERVRAILLLMRFGPRTKPALLMELLTSGEPRVRAAAMLAAGALGDSSADEAVSKGLQDQDAMVRRRAAEAVGPQLEANPYALLDDPDRLVRFAARRALEQTPREEWKASALAETKPRPALEAMLALIHTASGPQEIAERQAVIERLLPMLADPALDQQLRLDALYVFGLAWQNVEDAELGKRCAATLLPAFTAHPSDADRVQLATAAALARCGGAGVIEALIKAMDEAKQDRALQAHYAHSLSKVRQGWDSGSKEAMLAWFEQAAEWRGSGSASSSRSLGEWFDAFAGSVLTSAEARVARRRIPKLAGAAAGALTAEEILATQLSETEAPTGTAARGKDVFAQRCACLPPVRGPGIGARGGPGSDRRSREAGKGRAARGDRLPSRKVDERYRSEAFELADGSTLTAMVVREDAKVLLLRTAAQPRPISILKSRVKSRRTLEESIMPEGCSTASIKMRLPACSSFSPVSPARGNRSAARSRARLCTEARPSGSALPELKTL